MSRKKRNPFRPGAGEYPPLVVGRTSERRELRDRLERTRDGESGGIVVLYGPRGNGKTTLLADLEGLARKERKIRVRKLIPGKERAKDPNAPWKWSEGRADQTETKVVRGHGIARFLWRGKETKSVSVEENVEDLSTLATAGPLLLLVDEAHELPPGFGNVLLNSTQNCVASRLPLFAVFAGTPALPSRFQLMSASFWERCRRMEIGRLESDDAVREALSVPAERAGRPIEDDALELLVRESQRYPYFTQMHGATAWDAGRKREGTRITVEDARAGLKEAGTQRRLFHESRRRELFHHDVLDEAEAISEEVVALGESPMISRRRLMELFDGMVEQGISRDPGSAQETLAHLGLIWMVDAEHWEPGIPSLCAYLVEHLGLRPSSHQMRKRSTPDANHG